MHLPSRTALPFIAAASFLILLGQGCPTRPTPAGSQAPSDSVPAMPQAPVAVPPAGQGQEAVDVPPRSDSTEQPGEVLPKARYEPFTQAAYDQAVADGDPIFLYFYANWCPFCKEQDPRNQRVFAAYGKTVRGFRVNYNDSDTDADEQALAGRFRVTYQHTGIYLRGGTEEVKRTIGTESDEALIANLEMITR